MPRISPILKKLRNYLHTRKIQCNKFHKLKIPGHTAPIYVYVRDEMWIEKSLIKDGFFNGWEKDSLRIWHHLAENASHIIDIGANTGIYSLLAARAGDFTEQKKILAIEPFPLNYDVLKQNILYNDFKSITIIKCAVSDTSRPAEMYAIEDEINYMTSVDANRYEMHPEIACNKKVTKIEVQTKTLEEICYENSLTSIDLLKIDTEGHEGKILRESTLFLEKFKPTILVEVIGNENAEIINSIANKLDYVRVAIDEVSMACVVDNVWDNDHHNFLLTSHENILTLKKNNLIR